jgi:hypothetical protein
MSRLHDENAFPSLQNAAPIRRLNAIILGLKPELGKPSLSAVKLLFPIHGDSAPRSWSGLAQRMRVRRSEPLAFHLAIGLEVPKPTFTWFEALHDGMSCGLEMLACVLRWGAVTAADVSAFRAATKMKPPSVGCDALDASSATWRSRRVNARNMFAHVFLPDDV